MDREIIFNLSRSIELYDKSEREKMLDVLKKIVEGYYDGTYYNCNYHVGMTGVERDAKVTIDAMELIVKELEKEKNEGIEFDSGRILDSISWHKVTEEEFDYYNTSY